MNRYDDPNFKEEYYLAPDNATPAEIDTAFNKWLASRVKYADRHGVRAVELFAMNAIVGEAGVVAIAAAIAYIVASEAQENASVADIETAYKTYCCKLSRSLPVHLKEICKKVKADRKAEKEFEAKEAAAAKRREKERLEDERLALEDEKRYRASKEANKPSRRRMATTLRVVR